MASIVVLIGHDHQVTISQAFCVLVVVVELQPQDFHHVLFKVKRRINQSATHAKRNGHAKYTRSTGSRHHRVFHRMYNAMLTVLPIEEAMVRSVTPAAIRCFGWNSDPARTCEGKTEKISHDSRCHTRLTSR